MLFCGQCGFRLSPGNKQCPQCGALVDSGALGTDETPPDAPTSVTPSLPAHMQTQTEPPTQPIDPHLPPQHLVLRPGQDAGSYNNYGPQDAYEPTRRVEASEIDYGTPPRRPPANTDPAYPGYPQSGGAYPPQSSYPGYPQSGGNYVPQAPQGASYPGFAQQGMDYQRAPNQARNPPTSTNSRGRAAALFIILLGLLFMLIAMTLFILQHNGAIGSSNTLVVATAWMLPSHSASLTF